MRQVERAIADTEADSAFAGLHRYHTLVLAVSGGPDSLALLHLISAWQQRAGPLGPQITVATVDHGLRPAAASEAAAVGDMARALGLPHATLRWTETKPETGLPNAARNARYRLLGAHARARAEGFAAPADERVAVVTAHHQDDQAETVFMRLARGGGVAALAAMGASRALDGNDRMVDLVRPLLAFPKARLIATLQARGVLAFDDPSNHDQTHERPRVRRALEASGLEATALAATARRMRDAAEGLTFAEQAFSAALNVVLEPGIYARFDRRAFSEGPRILRQMVLTRLIGRFGGATCPPEQSELEALAARFGDDEAWRATLGGVLISAGARNVKMCREPARISRAAMPLLPGERVLWDGRFVVGYKGSSNAHINVAPLGRAAVLAVASGAKRSAGWPAAATYGLPAFFADGELLSVPQLGFRREVVGDAVALQFCSDAAD